MADDFIIRSFIAPHQSPGSSNAEFAQVSMPSFKRRRTDQYAASSQKYRPKPFKRFKPNNKSLESQVATLSKIVKKDHQTINRALDHADFYYPTVSTVPTIRVWNLVQLLQPVLWSPTLRRSNQSDTAVDATITKLNLELMVTHGLADVTTINWTFVLFKSKGDWIPAGGPSLRADLDWRDMGSANNVLLNEDFFKVIKRWNIRTKARSVGDMEFTSTPKRSFSMPMSFPLKRVPTTTTLGDTTWKTMTDSDFTRPEKIYFAWYFDTIGSQAVTVNPSITAGFKFTVKMLG